MSSENVIEIGGLGKCYQVYDKPRDRLLQMLFGRNGKSYYKEFWALRDISFAIPKGKVYGILGKNGAGKSTLLQVICGTLAPTTGTVAVKGKVAALLELGSGFNPEFTGIENIYMNAQLLGLRREQVDAKLEQIIAFADIGDYVHQPVKTYSSGMFARLAFSVTIHVEPDILIVDEALSVGDAWFQHKSMARMRKLMESGCTVLFVSHSIDAVRALCDHAIWIESGKVKMQGGVTEVTNAYMNDVFIEHNRIVLESMASDVLTLPEVGDKSAESGPMPGGEVCEAVESEAPAPAPNDGSVLQIESLQILDAQGKPTSKVEQGENFSLALDVMFHKSLRNVSAGFLIKDQFGQELTGESIFNTYRRSMDVRAGQRVRIRFSSSMLLRGGQSYSVAIRINQVSKWDRSDNMVIYADELALVFDVLADSNDPMWFKFRMPFQVTYQ
ncbi:ABC transporter [Frateuria sp. Soil773]|uniref:ABC transporter ATP-binding protein n=1 Tax=Frateuria sp. Soil773 TaxID=1736407 RepID=UPI0006F9D623|nr:ABC transporter ATP-binding protein [Frateuria sp. Soil773]KRE99941.1 ABC transporter [Frateuria sp. Soil773]